MTDKQHSLSTHRARSALEHYGAEYAHIWRRIDQMRELYRHRWPAHVFLPVARAGQILTETMRPTGRSPSAQQAMQLALLAAWRVTQGIYRFDQDLYTPLVSTAIEGDIPSETLHRLPEWCVYAETPDIIVEDRPQSICGAEIHGIWASVDWDDRTRQEQLIVGFDHHHAFAALPLPLHGSLDETIGAVIANMNDDRIGVEESAFRKRSHRMFQPVLSLLLYLCADDADISDQRPPRPEPKRTKSGLRIFPPDKPTKWDVGVRMGAALRRSHQASANEGEGGQTGRTPRAHVRRAHWHTFLAGPRTGARERRLKWLPPIPVNLDDVANLPSVIRPVAKT